MLADLVLNASLQNYPIDGALSGYLREIDLESSKNALFQCYLAGTRAITFIPNRQKFKLLLYSSTSRVQHLEISRHSTLKVDE